MKRIVGFIFLLMVISCSSRKNEETTQNKKSNKAVAETQNEQIQTKKLPTDTTSFEYFLKLTREDYSDIPFYLIEKFIGENYINKDDQYQRFYSHEPGNYRLGDCYVVFISTSRMGVCSDVDLITFCLDGKLKDLLPIEYDCDVDQSTTNYSYSDYTIYSDTLIEYCSVDVSAKDYKGSWLPDSVSISEVETIERKEYRHYIIKSTGRIEDLKCHSKILNLSDLKGKSSQELRIMRNEYFARHGYIFKDDELTNYFKSQEWYVPEFEYVEDLLNGVEIYNINIIAQAEKMDGLK